MGVISSYRDMSSKSLAGNKKPASRLNGVGSSDGTELGVIEKVQDYLKTISNITSNVPDQVQKSLVTIYMTINQSMMTALESAENIIKAAQDKTGDQSPLVKTALEKLTLATTELTKAAKKVQDLLEKIKDENEKEESNGGSSK